MPGGYRPTHYPPRWMTDSSVGPAATDAQDPPGGSPSRLRRRAIRRALLSRESYAGLLVILLVLIALSPLFSSLRFGALAAAVAVAGTLVLALRASDAQLGLVRIAVFVGISATLVAAAAGADSPDDRAAFSYAVIGLLLGWTLVAILRKVATDRVVTINTVLGALCAYLLLGLFFASAYGVIGSLVDEPVFSQQATADAGDFVYFSFVTQATVGYGDLTPGNQVMRSAAILEMVLGQAYLVIVVARSVSMLGTTRLSRDQLRGG